MSSMKPIALAAREPSGPALIVLTRTCCGGGGGWVWGFKGGEGVGFGWFGESVRVAPPRRPGRAARVCAAAAAPNTHTHTQTRPPNTHAQRPPPLVTARTWCLRPASYASTRVSDSSACPGAALLCLVWLVASHLVCAFASRLVAPRRRQQREAKPRALPAPSQPLPPAPSAPSAPPWPRTCRRRSRGSCAPRRCR